MGRKSVRRGRPPAEEDGIVRERLLRSALELFARRGFDASSVRDIAAAANVSDSALYAHFASKRELYDILFLEAGPSGITAAIAQHRADADDPGRFVRGLVEDLVNLWSRPRFGLFTSMIVRELATSAEFGKQLRPAIEATQTEVARVFAGWRATGRIRSRSSDMQLAWELFAPLIYLRIVHLQTHAGKPERARALELAREHAIHFVESVFVAD